MSQIASVHSAARSLIQRDVDPGSTASRPGDSLDVRVGQSSPNDPRLFATTVTFRAEFGETPRIYYAGETPGLTPGSVATVNVPPPGHAVGPNEWNGLGFKDGQKLDTDSVKDEWTQDGNLKVERVLRFPNDTDRGAYWEYKVSFLRPHRDPLHGSGLGCERNKNLVVRFDGTKEATISIDGEKLREIKTKGFPEAIAATRAPSPAAPLAASPAASSSLTLPPRAAAPKPAAEPRPQEPAPVAAAKPKEEGPANQASGVSPPKGAAPAPLLQGAAPKTQHSLETTSASRNQVNYSGLTSAQEAAILQGRQGVVVVLDEQWASFGNRGDSRLASSDHPTYQIHDSLHANRFFNVLSGGQVAERVVDTHGGGGTFDRMIFGRAPDGKTYCVAQRFDTASNTFAVLPSAAYEVKKLASARADMLHGEARCYDQTQFTDAASQVCSTVIQDCFKKFAPGVPGLSKPTPPNQANLESPATPNPAERPRLNALSRDQEAAILRNRPGVVVILNEAWPGFGNRGDFRLASGDHPTYQVQNDFHVNRFFNVLSGGHVSEHVVDTSGGGADFDRMIFGGAPDGNTYCIAQRFNSASQTFAAHPFEATRVQQLASARADMLHGEARCYNHKDFTDVYVWSQPPCSPTIRDHFKKYAPGVPGQIAGKAEVGTPSDRNEWERYGSRK